MFSFITKRFWWPRKRRWFLKSFLFFILKRKRKFKTFYFFKSKKKLIHGSRRRFFSIFSKNWILARTSKYIQRRLTPFRYFKRKTHFSNLPFNRRKRSRFVKIILRFTINNIFLTICARNNKILTYFSSGSVGFSGPTRTTSFASDRIIENAVTFLKRRRFKSVHLIVLSGLFNYRSKAVIDALSSRNINIKALTYKINVPHNGIRMRKAKRR